MLNVVVVVVVGGGLCVHSSYEKDCHNIHSSGALAQVWTHRELVEN